MKLIRKTMALLLTALLLLSAAALAAEIPEGEMPDYADSANWAYFALGEDTGVDVFLICPLVDTRSERNSFDLNDKLKRRFVSALDMEKGIYEEIGRLYSPYYRQMSLNAFKLSAEEQAGAREIAYGDVSASFRWYLDHENGGRGLILAGFSQGAQMCLELMKEYFGGDGAEAAALRERLVAVYAPGSCVTEKMTRAYPQIVPAKGEMDTGVVISFDCEDGTLTETMIIPAGTKALSINPLNWRTDGTAADKSLNYGAVIGEGTEPVAAFCGARIGERGELVVTDVRASDYPPGLELFPEGSYHIYDYQFFFMNLKENAAARTQAWRSGLPFKDAAADAWYVPAVKAAWEKGLMEGTGPSTFGPAQALTRAQLVTILWRMAGAPAVNQALLFDDVQADAWYAEAVRWASASDLVERDGSFGPDDAVTREEAAVILRNYAELVGADIGQGENGDILRYGDAFEISEDCIPALRWAVSAGLIKGTPEGTLEPRGKLTRVQAAAILLRLGSLPAAPASLSLWTSDAPAAAALIAYVEAVTDETGPDYIPVRDRIAVFDLDGTLFCETDPNYFDYTLLAYRVLDDPDYRDRASDFEREVANKIREQNLTGQSFPGLEVDHGRAVASAFAGMTVSEFNDYIQEFKKQPMPGYRGMNRGEGFYRPMVQVVNYLLANDFTVYIVSGTDRLIVRGILYDSVLDIPNRQIIGSDETIVSSNQGETDGLNYVFTEGDQLILGGEFLIKNLKMNKVSVIMQEIGQQPVLSFGNSTGDSSMAEYVTSGNPYRSLAFMLCCDDTEREDGSLSKADKMFALCEEFGWVPISMKNDWKTIYGDGVIYLGGSAAEAAQPAA